MRHWRASHLKLWSELLAELARIGRAHCPAASVPAAVADEVTPAPATAGDGASVSGAAPVSEAVLFAAEPVIPPPAEVAGPGLTESLPPAAGEAVPVLQILASAAEVLEAATEEPNLRVTSDQGTGSFESPEERPPAATDAPAPTEETAAAAAGTGWIAPRKTARTFLGAAPWFGNLSPSSAVAEVAVPETPAGDRAITTPALVVQPLVPAPAPQRSEAALPARGDHSIRQLTGSASAFLRRVPWKASGHGEPILEVRVRADRRDDAPPVTAALAEAGNPLLAGMLSASRTSERLASRDTGRTATSSAAQTTRRAHAFLTSLPWRQNR